MDNYQLNRRIRLFVSSTFKDMEMERNHLANKVFPQLRSICLRRGVEFVELDLRWGITDEDSQNGKVAEICLNEIERTRPFFIGLLGNRYGWVPTEKELIKNPALRRNFSWIDNDIAQRCSITEMEMQFGALRFNEKTNAFFYLKGADAHTEQTYKEVEDSEASFKLSNLKKQIWEQDRYPVREYNSVEELEQRIIADFTEVLDLLYPMVELSEVDLIRIEQNAFKDSLTSMYIPDDQIYRRLDEFAKNNVRKMFITGSSGSGKSALIANWSKKRSDLKIISYSFQASPNSERTGKYITYLAEEIFRLFGMQSRNVNKEEFKQLVSEVEDQLFVLVDYSVSSSSVLSDLMAMFQKARIVFTLSDNDSAIPNLKQRGFDVVQIKELNADSRKAMITEYLAYYGKSLPEESVDKIISDEKLVSPYLLKLFLSELKVFGIHEQIIQHIDHFLSAESIPDCIDRLLERAEKEYGGGQNKYVDKIFNSVALSHEGFFESEIMEIFAIPPVYWAQFYSAMEEWFGYYLGRLYLSNPLIAQCITKKYESSAQRTRECLINYFLEKIKEDTPEKRRMFNELAWQYLKLEKWEQLYQLLLCPNVLTLLFPRDLAVYWSALEKHGYSLELYSEMDYTESEPSSLYAIYDAIASICDRLRKDQLYLYYKKRAVEIGKTLKTASDPMDNALRSLGIRCIDADQLTLAKETLLEALDESLKRKNNASSSDTYNGLMPESDNADYSTSQTYNSLGVLYWHKKQYNESVKMYYNAVEIMEPISKKYPHMKERVYKKLGIFYNNLGNSYADLRDDANAKISYLKSVEYRQYNFDKDIDDYEILKTYGSLALLYKRENNLDKATQYHNLIINTYEEINQYSDRFHEDKWRAYYNATIFFNDQNNVAKAEELILKALDVVSLQITLNVGTYKVNYGRTCMFLGELYRVKQNYTLSEQYLIQAIEMFDKIKHDRPDYLFELCKSYGRLVLVYYKMSNFDKSEEACKQMIALFEHLPIRSDRKYLSNHYVLMCNMAYMYSLKFNYQYKKAISHVERKYENNPLCNVIIVRLYAKWVESLVEDKQYKKACPIWRKGIQLAFETMLDYPSEEMFKFLNKDIREFDYMLGNCFPSVRKKELLFLDKITYLTKLFGGNDWVSFPNMIAFNLSKEEGVSLCTDIIEGQIYVYNKIKLLPVHLKHVEISVQKLISLYPPGKFAQTGLSKLVSEFLLWGIQEAIKLEENSTPNDSVSELIYVYIQAFPESSDLWDNVLCDLLCEAKTSDNYTSILEAIDKLK